MINGYQIYDYKFLQGLLQNGVHSQICKGWRIVTLQPVFELPYGIIVIDSSVSMITQVTKRLSPQNIHHPPQSKRIRK